MDDLNQIAIDRLETSVLELIAKAVSMQKSRDLWRIAAFGLAVVAIFIALDDLGVFKP